MSQYHGKCQNPVQQSVAVTIPGDIFEWVMENDGGKDIKECLVSWKIEEIHLYFDMQNVNPIV